MEKRQYLFKKLEAIRIIAVLLMSAALFFTAGGCSWGETDDDEDDSGSIDGGNNGGSDNGGNNNGGNNNGGNQNNNNGFPGLKAVGSSSSSITISWNAVLNANYYYVYVSESSAGPYTKLGGTSSLSYTSSKLATATTYYYKVEAATGSYSWDNILRLSSAVSGTTLLTAPTGAKAASLTSSSITVTWNNFATATAYRIYKSESSSGAYTEIGTSTTNSYTDEGLPTNTTYYYKVSARNENLEGDQSSSVSATVLLHAPKNVTAAGSSSSSITVSWDAVLYANRYNVYVSESSTGLYTNVGYTSSLSYTHKNLAGATTYYYKVEATTGSYSWDILGQLSESVSATAILKAPAGVKAESLTSSSITITWNDLATATAYRIYRSASSSGTFAEIGTSTTNSYTDDEGLMTNTTYYYKVSAYNDALEGDQSSSVSATVLLHAPKNVTAAGSSSSSITVSWDAVLYANRYNVYVSESSTGLYTNVGYTSSLSYTHKNLAGATTYYYKVEAATGSYSWDILGQLSESVSATTN